MYPKNATDLYILYFYDISMIFCGFAVSWANSVHEAPQDVYIIWTKVYRNKRRNVWGLDVYLLHAGGIQLSFVNNFDRNLEEKTNREKQVKPGAESLYSSRKI